MSPKISIIVPISHCSQHLDQTLSSICKQSLKDIEIICVNGIEDEQTELWINNAIGNDSRVKRIDLIHKVEFELYNAGLEAATGEYVHFLLPNDRILDFAYEALYNKTQRYNLDYLHFATAPYNRKTKQVLDIPQFNLQNLEAGDFNRILNFDATSLLYTLDSSAWTGLYRRSFLQKYAINFGTHPVQFELFFFWSTITHELRAAISRDCLILHDFREPKLPEGKKAFDLFKKHLEALDILRASLSERNVPEDLVTIALSQSIRPCIDASWHAALNEVDAPEVSHKIEACIRTLPGPLWNDAFKWLKTAQKAVAVNCPPKPKTYNAIPFFHKKSVHPAVSIVIPTYNQEEYLNQALYSLTTQTLEDLEFICINDGSTDHSLAIYHEYATIDKRFHLIDKPNTGYGNSMNRGIDIARGKYLGILEPADYVLPEMYERLYSIANRKSLDFIKGDFYTFGTDANGIEDLRLNCLSRDNSYYGQIINPSSNIKTFTFIMNTWSGIYSMNFLNKWHIRHNETPGASFQDNGFWFQTFARATRAQFIKTPFYMNRRDKAASSVASSDKMYAMTKEYEYIHDWLCSEPGLLERYESIYWRKKLDNAFFTYHRMPLAAKAEYAEHMRSEFTEPLAQGKINRELSDEVHWKLLAEIIADPKTFAEKIRVSVIMPVHNAERYIRETLDCLVYQQDYTVEFICVDDGSTDSTAEILDEYAKKFNHIKVIRQQNAGAGTARNVGMKYAQGEYLMFLDCDDIYELTLLRTAYEKAYLQNSDMVVFRSDDYFEDMGTYRKAEGSVRTNLLPAMRPFAGEDIYFDIFRAFIGWPWDKLFRADFVRKYDLKFQEQRTTNDMLFVFSAIVRAKRISTIDAVLAHHRRASGSLSVTREKSWRCFYDALVALRSRLHQWGLWERYERDFINYALHFALWNLNTLRGETYEMLFDQLKHEWFEDLGIVGKPASYFYHQDDYESYIFICDNDASLYISRRISLLVEKNRKQADRLTDIRSDYRNLNKQFKANTSQLEKIRSTSAFKVGTKLLALGYSLQLIKK